MPGLLCVVVISLVSLPAPLIRAVQENGTQSADQSAKAAALIQQAIAARGGNRYVDVKNVVTRGQFAQYQKGNPGVPQQFVDYIVYPDRERTEFGKGGHRFVQTNSGNTGWTYDSESKLLKDQTDEQVKSYQQGARYDLDNLLRREWKEPDAKLAFLNLREVLPSTFAEGVRIDFKDGGSATIYFDQATHLPIMTEFKTITENGPRNDQWRFYQWIDFGGVKCPRVQDTYQAGVQSSRAYFDSYEFNANIPDRLFEKPTSPKDVK